MKNVLITICLVLCVLTTGVFAGTIATFSDPALNGSTPLFNVTTTVVNGGWSDLQTGLDLQVVLTGNTFNDAFFTMTSLTVNPTPVIITGGLLTYGTTTGGTIKFFADNQSPSTTPILQIDFDSASVTFGGVGGDNIFSSNGVKFSGSEIGSKIFTEEVFAFSFANLQRLAPVTNNSSGYTTTAAFTSSATAVPEPATLAILGLGSLMLFKRKRTA